MKATRKLTVRRSVRFDAAIVDVEIILQHVLHERMEERCHAGEEWTYHVDLGDVKDEVDVRLRQILGEVRARRLLLAVGSVSNWRKRLSPEYKSGRPRKPLGYAKVVGWLHEEYDVSMLPWLEADDVIGLAATAPGANVVVVSSDKDMRTIPGWYYNPDRPKPEVELIDTLAADLNHYVLALAGDPTDGYKGARGVGEVSARRALEGRPKANWPGVARSLFLEAGHDLEYALLQMRLSRVLRCGEYKKQSGTVKLWTWPDQGADR